jgi:hypothetical protein
MNEAGAHPEVEELLAGHVLRALDEEDERRVTGLIAGHLPWCPPCRLALDELQAATGELAVATSPLRPPKLLARRLRRATADHSVRGAFVIAAGATAVVAVAFAVLWSAHLSGRVTRAEHLQDGTAAVLATVSHPNSHVVPLVVGRAQDGRGQLAAAYVPGLRTLYLFGSMPSPLQHRVYQVWLTTGARTHPAATFVPNRGVVVLRIDVDPEAYDGLLITEEDGPNPAAPSSVHVVDTSL